MADAVAYWRQFTVTWDPQEIGDTLVGHVVALLEYKTRDDHVPKLKIRTENGDTYFVIASQKRLLAGLHALKPKVGDPILIRYLGDEGRSAPGMSPTQRFEVRVREGVTAHAQKTARPA